MKTKSDYAEVPLPTVSDQRKLAWSSGSRLKRALIAALVTVLLWDCYSLAPRAFTFPRGNKPSESATDNERANTTTFRWSSLTPSRDLQYHDCFNGFQCARLDLPMDYHSENSPDRVALAIIRKPAKVPVSDPRYGGAILVNPGGPGGSGVAKVLYHGALIQQIVDAANEATEADSHQDDGKAKYFDIVGFDPRGVNNSTPILTCFPDNFARQTWDLQVQAEGLLGSSEGSLRTAWRRARAYTEGCSSSRHGGESENTTSNYLEHVNTTPVAADMAQIIERHGEWREREGVKAAQAAFDARDEDSQQRQSIIARTKWQRGTEQIQYWGFSYGTLLGATFAAMYPEKVSRMVLDGVVDAEDYYNGPWLGNLVDTDLILHKVWRYCSEAGPERCQFWRPGGPQAIHAVYEKVLHDIWDDPLSVPGDNRRRGPEIITWTDVKMVVKNALYQPVMLGPVMAELLQDITNGTGALFAEYKQSARKPSCRSAQCEIDGPYSEECVSPDWNELEATSAVLCTDAEGIGSLTEDEFRSYWETLRGQSSAMGDYWAQTRLGCAGWKARAKWRVSGPFGKASPEADVAAKAKAEADTLQGCLGNDTTVPEDSTDSMSTATAHPILFVSNTLDTVTPLRMAQKMSSRFPGSVLLQQDAEGHCSFTAPSLCTAKAIRRYFQTGVMPQPATRCKPDIKPFELPRENLRERQDLTRLSDELASSMSEEDVTLLAALVDIARTSKAGREGWNN
ncbi:hypothetical protein ABEF95_010793 [Exophiala dermatitidis]